MIFRRGGAADLDGIAIIQSASPEAARWDVAEYLNHDLLVADSDGRVAGFLVARPADDQECDLLNLAVGPDYRRKGVGTGLVRALIACRKGAIFLEVRESNQIARKFYKSLGFQEVGLRLEYYYSPPESGIVMKFYS